MSDRPSVIAFIDVLVLFSWGQVRDSGMLSVVEEIAAAGISMKDSGGYSASLGG